MKSGKLPWLLGGAVCLLIAFFFFSSMRQPTTANSSRNPAQAEDGSSNFFGEMWDKFKGSVLSDDEKEKFVEFKDSPEALALKTEGEKRGREIWFKATGGNGRFHAYVIPQRVGDRIMDFGRMFSGDSRATRFDDWGLINEPGCCKPGSKGCPATDPKQTYGFDWCPGDDELLKYVGKKDQVYRDPACDFDPRPGLQSSCDLKFGTSAGAVGFRKFPNPRFDAQKWANLTGGLDSWKNYSKNSEGKESDKSRMGDASIEPPFLVGIACASCHASFDPTRPPKDQNHPTWNNIGGLVGAQYMYSSQVFGAGFSPHSLEWQILTNARPGTVDTSAVPNDFVNNPGTMNAIINFTKRPTKTFPEERVNAWRVVSSCSPGAVGTDNCSCNEQGGRCYEKSEKTENVLHILKGGEDSIGPQNAILRVHFNIGVCAEQCWINHLTDLRVLDPSQRNYGQTPFDIGQCRKDCGAYRALEDRIEDELAFVLSGRPYDLHKAKGITKEELEKEIEGRFKMPGAVARGRAVFAKECATCHSSIPNQTGQSDFLATDENGVRNNWMGNDARTPATSVGTYQCRSLHSNHMKGHVWQDYASETYRELPEVKGMAGEASGGRGYYRNISLLSVWAFAPFMHNNAVGPEVCASHPTTPDFRLYGTGIECKKENHFDSSVDGRLKLFEASMEALLNPENRGEKITRTTEDVEIPLGIMLNKKSYRIVIPKGIRVSRIGSFRHKDLVANLRKYIVGESDKVSDERVRVVFKSLKDSLMNTKDGRIVISEDMLAKLGEVYSNCNDLDENKGHEFGKGLSSEDKKALTAFMETL